MVTVVLGLFVRPPMAVAQNATRTGPAGAVGAGCAGGPPQPIGSVVDTVFASLRETDQPALPDAYTAMLLRGLIQNFTPSSPLGVPVFGGPIHQPRPSENPVAHRGRQPVSPAVHVPDTVSVAISGEVVFTVQRDGHLTDARLLSSTLSSALDAQLLHAVSALDSMHALPPPPNRMHGGAATFVFTAGKASDSMSVSEPLFTATMPIWTMERPAQPKLDNPAPRYPPGAERGRVEDEVLVSFAIDDQGVPRMETIRLLRATYQEFARAVLKVLPQWRFEPARIAGCPVTQRVQMPFSFKVAY